MTNLEKYKQVFVETFDVSEEMLGKDFIFEGVDKWDSVAHLGLISALEDTFDVMFETDDILHFESFENGKKILSNLGVIFD